MDHCFPDWNFDENFLLSTQRRSFQPENELVELLWRDGQVVLQSQTQRRSTVSDNPLINEPTAQPLDQDHHHHHQRALRPNESSCDDTFLEDQGTVSWIQDPPDDPFEKEFSSNFFSKAPSLDPIQPENLRFGGWERPAETSRGHNTMPPPKFRVSDSKAVKFGDFVKEASAMTVGPSHCGSNQLQNDLDITTVATTAAAAAATTNTTGLSVGSLNDNDGKDVFMRDGCKNVDDRLEPNATSSSGGSSGCSFGRTSKEADTSGRISGRKRKETMETEESLFQSRATGNKSIRRSGSTRRSRAAEVHNLSERRRRDRINEKMRALQELIPHCTKTDKASILDEAIDYLKSLQLQLQVVWMGSGMAPMMFSGLQPYIPRMGIQMPSPIHNPINLPGFPVLDRSTARNPGLVCQNPVLNPVHQFQNQPQNPVFSDQFARYLGGFPQMHAASQPMNMVRFGSQMVQQTQASAPASGAAGGGGAVIGGGAAATTHNLPLSK